MALDKDHKVVLVLDHGPRFAAKSGVICPINIKDVGAAETKKVGQLEKQIWSWCIESILEFHRIVHDLYFDNDRLLRVVVSDTVSRILQPEWGDKLVDPNAFTASLSKIGPAVAGDESSVSVLSGLMVAVEALSQRSSHQAKLSETLKNKAELELKANKGARKPVGWKEKVKTRASAKPQLSVETVKNVGSIVLFTSFRTEQEVNDLEREMNGLIESRNKIISNLNSDNWMRIDHVNLYIVNAFPLGANYDLQGKMLTKFSNLLSTHLVSRPAGEQMINATHSVCIDLYSLISTTVSGIPMKEEAQKGQSSVNYDVELLHPRAAHDKLESLGLVGATGFLKDYIGNSSYPTFRLSWATPSPKSRWNLFPRTRSAFRATPACVSSRPSVCLTTFLLHGRNVMLEVNRKSGPAKDLQPNVNTKLISHTLIVHGGRIYIHSIDIMLPGVRDIIPPRVVRELATKDSNITFMEKDLFGNSSSEEDDKQAATQNQSILLGVADEQLLRESSDEGVATAACCSSSSDDDVINTTTVSLDNNQNIKKRSPTNTLPSKSRTEDLFATGSDNTTADEQTSDDDIIMPKSRTRISRYQQQQASSEDSSDEDESTDGSTSSNDEVVEEFEVVNLDDVMPFPDDVTVAKVNKNDLQFKEFVAMMKQCTLRRPKKGVVPKLKSSSLPLQQPIERLRQFTRYFPVATKDSLIHSVFPDKRVDVVLLTIAAQTTISDEDFGKCKQAIKSFCEHREAGDDLLQTCPKFAEQYSLSQQYQHVLCELACLLVNHLETSCRHKELFNFFMQYTSVCHVLQVPPSGEPLRLPLPPTVGNVPPGKYVASQVNTTSRSTSPVAKKPKLPAFQWKTGEVINVYDFFCSKQDDKYRPTRKEFVGREKYGNKAILYEGIDFSAVPARKEA